MADKPPIFPEGESIERRSDLGAGSRSPERLDAGEHHRAGVGVRLRAELGRLVMEDVIRQEAMRPFFRAIRRRACGRQRQGPRKRVRRLLNVARGTRYATSVSW
jgi:hypothetical protein